VKHCRESKHIILMDADNFLGSQSFLRELFFLYNEVSLLGKLAINWLGIWVPDQLSPVVCGGNFVCDLFYHGEKLN
jgi:hypothetical protein